MANSSQPNAATEMDNVGRLSIVSFTIQPVVYNSGVAFPLTRFSAKFYDAPNDVTYNGHVTRSL